MSTLTTRMTLESRRILTLLISLFALLVTAAPLTQAAEQIDQSNIAAPTTNLAAVYTSQQFGQVFTVGLNGFLSEVAMYVDKRGTPAANLIAEVQGVTNGLPNGNVLASATLTPAQVVNGLNAFNVLGAGVVVSSGDILAIVLKSTAGLGNDYLAREVPGNFYPAGQAVINATGWTLFGTPEQGFDAIFQTKVQVVDQVLPHGSATRLILEGSAFGFPIPSFDEIQGGVDERNTLRWYFHIPTGWSFAQGRMIENGMTAGAYSATSGGFPCSGTCGIGAGRGIAWRTFTNDEDIPVTRNANAILDGIFSGNGGSATAIVYAFDTAQLDDTLNAASPDAAHFLLTRDGLAEISAGGADLSLANKFPVSARLGSVVQRVGGSSGERVSLSLKTNNFTVGARQTVTIMFDISAYSPSTGGAANFASTLSPDTVFFADENDAPVTTMTAAGPVIEPDVVPTSLALTPATASNPVGSAHSVTATVEDGLGNPVADAVVFFTINSGPNAGVSGPVGTDANGMATFSYTDSGGVDGTDHIQAAIGALQSDIVNTTWTTPGSLDHISISPATANIPPGGSQTYTVAAFDMFNNSRGDVTASTVFTITDGSCTDNTCTATTTGGHTVTGTSAGKTATSILTVENTGGFNFSGFFQPVDNPPVVNVVKAGAAVPVKFSLGGDHGLAVMAPGYPSSQTVVCDSLAPSSPVTEETVSAGGSGLSYDAALDQYTYVWKTSKSWSNTCRRLNVRLSDGSEHVANFSFAK